jgi:glycosyltransferase involved in cell wall biosynthesis
MRVALLSFYDFEEVRGGTELFSNYLLSTFPEAEFITFSKSKEYVFGPSLARFNLEYPRMAMAMSRRLQEICKEKQIDVAFSNDISGLGLKLMVPGLPSAIIFHYTYHEMAEKALMGTRGYLPSRHLMPRVESLAAIGKTVVAVSPKVQRALKVYYKLDSKVIENGIPLDVFKPLDKMESRERIGIKWRGPLGIFVGRAESSKGFDIVQAIAKRRKDIKILCVTTSPVEEKELIVAKAVKNADMPMYYSAADFLFFPSRYESLSYTSIEALACDLPVVASRTGVFEDLKEEEVGVLVDSFEPDDYSKGIDRVASLDIHPRDLAKQRFSLDRFRADYINLAKELAKERK